MRAWADESYKMTKNDFKLRGIVSWHVIFHGTAYAKWFRFAASIHFHSETSLTHHGAYEERKSRFHAKSQCSRHASFFSGLIPLKILQIQDKHWPRPQVSWKMFTSKVFYLQRCAVKLHSFFTHAPCLQHWPPKPQCLFHSFRCFSAKLTSITSPVTPNIPHPEVCDKLCGWSNGNNGCRSRLGESILKSGALKLW